MGAGADSDSISFGMPLKRIAFITTIPMSLAIFHLDQIRALIREGYEVHAITAPGEFQDQLEAVEGLRFHAVPMTRGISPIRDLASLVKLCRVFSGIHPDLVVSGTPKAALLSGLAGWWQGIRARLLIVHGSPAVTATGVKRWILRWTDWLTAYMHHRVIYVSQSLREEMECICGISSARGDLLGRGAIKGIDLTRFSPQRSFSYEHCPELAALAKERQQGGGPVLGFVGRLAVDKGIADLLFVWQNVRESYSDARLLLVGPMDNDDPLPTEFQQIMAEDDRIIQVGFCAYVEETLALMDVLVFPSRREGFGLAIIEAAAMQVPAVCYDVTGCQDSVVDGETGLRVPALDREALLLAVQRYLSDDELFCTHGRNAREFVSAHYESEMVENRYVQYYRDLLL